MAMAIHSADADCYHGGAFYTAIGEDFRHLDRSQQIINADVLDAWFDPAPGVTAALREYLPWILKTSPPTQAHGMGDAIAAARGIPCGSILPGGGSSDLIFLALGRFLNSASRVLILDPMYGEYAHLLERVIGCQVERLQLCRADGYIVDPEVLATRMAAGFDAVILVNPNSPTGRYLPSGTLERILAEAPPKTLLWVDETYLNFVDGAASLELAASRSQRLFVCTSLSKAYALSGARCAYLVGPESRLRELRRWTPPWAVSHVAQIAACAALAAPTYYRECWTMTHSLRHDLAMKLADLGLDPVPGTANFLLCHLGPGDPTAAELMTACRQYGLFLRDVTDMGRMWRDQVFRIAVKDASTNARMMSLLAEVLANHRRG